MSSSGLNKNHASAAADAHIANTVDEPGDKLGKVIMEMKVESCLSGCHLSLNDKFDIEQLGHDMQTKLVETNREPGEVDN